MASGDYNAPDEEEMSQQKSEAYSALANYHETSLSSSVSGLASSLLGDEALGIGGDDDDGGVESYWECLPGGATSYAVSADPASGLKRSLRQRSKTYKGHRCRVSIEIDLSSGQARKLKLAETYRFLDGDGDESGGVFARSSILGDRADVDSLDGSYSLDVTADPVPSSDDDDDGDLRLPLLPSELLGPKIDPSAVTFIVEHTLAVSGKERCRCFLVYGDDEILGGEEDTTRRLIGVVLLEENKVVIEPEKPAAAPSKPSEPLDFIEVKADGNGNDMNRVYEALERNAEAKNDEEKNNVFERYSPGLFGLTSAPWLGDAVVRDRIVPKSSEEGGGGRGFGPVVEKKGGKKKGGDDSGEESFAAWSLGVQKVALQYKWNYADRVDQLYTYGNSMGPSVRPCTATTRGDGTVALDETGRQRPGRKTTKRNEGEEKMVVLDMNGGAYVTALIGSRYFRAPRYISLSKSRNYDAEPLVTEVILFQRPNRERRSSSEDPADLLPVSEVDGGDAFILDDDVDMMDAPEPEERVCSSMTRLYDGNDGRFIQGCTSFFSTKRPPTMDGEATVS